MCECNLLCTVQYSTGCRSNAACSDHVCSPGLGKILKFGNVKIVVQLILVLVGL